MQIEWLWIEPLISVTAAVLICIYVGAHTFKPDYLFSKKHTKNVFSVSIYCHSSFSTVGISRSSLVAQQVKDLTLSLLWHRFDPQPGNFCMPWAQPKEKKSKQYEFLSEFGYMYLRCARWCRVKSYKVFAAAGPADFPPPWVFEGVTLGRRRRSPERWASVGSQGGADGLHPVWWNCVHKCSMR